MNLKHIEDSLEDLKNLSPLAFKKTMEVSLPFFALHKKLYENGEAIIKSRFNINQSELDVLGVLFYYSNKKFRLTPTELYEKLLFSSGGMTKVLKKLESRGFVARMESESDKRSKLVEITEAGKKICEEAITDIVAFEDLYFSKLDKNEQKIFRDLLYKTLEEK